jgi:hypothetical protein
MSTCISFMAGHNVHYIQVGTAGPSIPVEVVPPPREDWDRRAFDQHFTLIYSRPDALAATRHHEDLKRFDGLTFVVHNPERLRELLAVSHNRGTFASFQLLRVRSGAESAALFYPCFDEPAVCKYNEGDAPDSASDDASDGEQQSLASPDTNGNPGSRSLADRAGNMAQRQYRDGMSWLSYDDVRRGMWDHDPIPLLSDIEIDPSLTTPECISTSPGHCAPDVPRGGYNYDPLTNPQLAGGSLMGFLFSDSDEGTANGDGSGDGSGGGWVWVTAGPMDTQAGTPWDSSCVRVWVHDGDRLREALADPTAEVGVDLQLGEMSVSRRKAGGANFHISYEGPSACYYPNTPPEFRDQRDWVARDPQLDSGVLFTRVLASLTTAQLRERVRPFLDITIDRHNGWTWYLFRAYLVGSCPLCQGSAVIYKLSDLDETRRMLEQSEARHLSVCGARKAVAV